MSSWRINLFQDNLIQSVAKYVKFLKFWFEDSLITKVCKLDKDVTKVCKLDKDVKILEMSFSVFL
jgi:hypothetical protein